MNFDCEYGRDEAVRRISKKDSDWFKLIPEQDKTNKRTNRVVQETIQEIRRVTHLNNTREAIKRRKNRRRMKFARLQYGTCQQILAGKRLTTYAKTLAKARTYISKEVGSRPLQ